MSQINNDIKPDCHVFTGKPRELGRQYGTECYDNIKFNEGLLNWVGFGNNVRKSLKDPKFLKWMHRREEIIGDNWLDILEEIRGVAETSGLTYEEILCINLRAWWYNSEDLVREWGMVPPERLERRAGDAQCTGIAVKMANGNIAAGGALDDGKEVYCGPVKFCPENGYRFLSFPISGTIWGSIGMNSEGLCLRSASGSLRIRDVATLEKDACEFDDLNIDIIQGVILRTCKTVDEARNLCRKFPFNGNVMCVDANGDVVSIQNTPTGPMEMPFDGFQCFTNHIADDEDYYKMYSEMGIVECVSGPMVDSRIRRGYVMNFLRSTYGSLTQEQMLEFMSIRDDSLSAVHSSCSIAIGYGEPQKYKNTMWIRQPQAEKHGDLYLKFDI